MATITKTRALIINYGSGDDYQIVTIELVGETVGMGGVVSRQYHVLRDAETWTLDTDRWSNGAARAANAPTLVAVTARLPLSRTDNAYLGGGNYGIWAITDAEADAIQADYAAWQEQETARRAAAPRQSNPYANCRSWTPDEGCPLHGELCNPEYQ